MKFFCIILLVFLVSCKVYMDGGMNNISTGYMTFDFGTYYNTLDYFSDVNAIAGNEVFYNTFFTIKLPKKLVYGVMHGNDFYFEYDSKQIIYIYNEFRNVGKDSNVWNLIDVEDEEDIYLYLDAYWINVRGYDEDYLFKKNGSRVTKLYTNGKYKILLYNIKKRNYKLFLYYVKSFEVKNK
jgi:hypothetical protein